MLNGTLTLHGIRDTEAFCTHILQNAKLQLTEHDRQDLLTYLIEECWILSTRYQPGGITFSTYAGHTLRNRITDWLRTNKQDHRYPTRYTLHPLDNQLDHTHTTSPLDHPEHRDPDLLRLLRDRHRPGDRPYTNLGQSTTRRAA
jgi:DNA-directed RNA polymerase specialized sigma24 family protein